MSKQPVNYVLLYQFTELVCRSFIILKIFIQLLNGLFKFFMFFMVFSTLRITGLFLKLFLFFEMEVSVLVKIIQHFNRFYLAVTVLTGNYEVSDNDDYYLTYKGKGLLSREEYNLALNKEAYEHLLTKADGIILIKKRYMIPVPGSDHLTIELDVFEGHYHGLILAEVEFASEEEAKAFNPPAWFVEDVTFSGEYHNSRLSKG